MIRVVSETGSTNADLIAALRTGEPLPEGHWLVADRQSGGRGRQGRQWFDEAGNFMGSTAVRMSARDPAPATLALVAALAVYEAVRPLLAEPHALRIKWPNDLMLGTAKLAGILLEREGDTIVIGVGVNLATAPEVPGRATIALSAVGPTPDRDLFAQSLAVALDRELGRWRMYGVEPLTRRWTSVAHAHGTPLVVQPPGESALNGTFAGLTPEGALRLALPNDSTRIIHAGDVMFATEKG